MINQDTFNKYSLNLIDIIDLVQMQMIIKISRQLGKGKSLSDDDWKLLMLQSVGRLDIGLQSVIKGSTAQQAKELQAIRERAVKQGLRDTDEQLSRLGKVSTEEFFINQNEKLLETVATKLNQDIAKANLTMLRTAGNDYVKMINDVLAVKELGGISRQEATKQILSKWSESGIPALTDSLGRRWQPDAYVNMVVRTNSLQIAKATQGRRAIEYGYDLILTSQHASQSPEHAPFANKIYSLSGNDPKYPPFSQATSAGFITRPKCKHTYSFYFEGEKPKSLPKRETDKNYKMAQEQRKLERTIKAQKRKINALEAAGLDAKAESAKLRSYQADMRTFIDETGRTRQRDREQV